MARYDERIVIHHVGGRSGSRSFPVLPVFEADLVNVMYDADPDCLPQITQRWEAQPSTTRVFPYCLGAHQGTRTFHINYDPYASSVFPLNPRYASFYYVQEQAGYDYVLGDTMRTVSTTALPTVTLDDLVLDRGEVPAPDFLSVDTQGSELEILQGASQLLASSILALQLEVEFHPLYQGQPLFGDICAFLDRCGYDLIDLRIFAKKHPMRGKQGFRGEGYVTDGEAVFFKRPERIAADANTLRALQLNKLAFIATVFGRFECAQQCLEAPDFTPLDSPRRSDGAAPRYLVFIARLADAVAALSERTVPLFSSRLSLEQSRARFTAGQAPAPSAVRERLKAIAGLVHVVRTLRRIRQALRSAWRVVGCFRARVAVQWRWRLKWAGSPVEAVFLEFGMREQFVLALRHRLQDRQHQRPRCVAGAGTAA